VTTTEIAYAICVVVLASTVQGASGFGFSLTAMPLLSTQLGVEQALVLSSLVALPSTLVTVASAHAHVDRPAVMRMFGAAIVGMPFGLVVLKTAPERALRIGVAVTVLGLAIAVRRGVRVRGRPGVVDLVAGLISGVLNTSVGTNGPPLVIGLASRSTPAPVMRSTLSSVFAMSGVVAISLFAFRGYIDADDLRAAAFCLPGVAIGWTIGNRVFKGFDQRRFDHVVVGLLIASALWATYNALA
jgi:uncharacterized protein